MVAHEISHTQQQNGNSGNLLEQSIKEGACDFIAEQIYKPVSSSYMDYGNLHEKQLTKISELIESVRTTRILKTGFITVMRHQAEWQT